MNYSCKKIIILLFLMHTISVHPMLRQLRTRLTAPIAKAAPATSRYTTTHFFEPYSKAFYPTSSTAVTRYIKPQLPDTLKYKFQNMPKFTSPTEFKTYIHETINNFAHRRFIQFLKSKYPQLSGKNIHELEKNIIQKAFNGNEFEYERMRHYMMGKISVRALDYFFSDKLATMNLTAEEETMYYELKARYMKKVAMQGIGDTSYDAKVKYTKWKARQDAIKRVREAIKKHAVQQDADSLTISNQDQQPQVVKHQQESHLTMTPLSIDAVLARHTQAPHAKHFVQQTDLVKLPEEHA